MPEPVLEESVIFPQLGTGLGPYPACTLHPELPAEITSKAVRGLTAGRVRNVIYRTQIPYGTISSHFIPLHIL